MADNITYQVGFIADTKQLKASLNSILSDLQKLGKTPQIIGDLQKASTAALDLARNLQSAVNVQTGKLDLTNFNNNLKNSGQSLQGYYDQLKKLGPEGQQAFLNVASAISEAELPLKRTNQLMSNLWTTMKNTMRWQLTSSALNAFTGSISTAYQYSKNLDKSLNDIRIVSNKSAQDMAEFAKYANDAAKSLSSTTTKYTDASLIYYQQGLTDEEVVQRTNTTIKMANVTRTSAEEVSEQLTSIWNNFDDGTRSIESYADAMVALGAATASSSDEIAEGVKQFAAVGSTVGLSYDYATTALATLTAETRQSANVVGTSLRTLFARIQGLTQDETQEDGTDLNKYSRALNAVGIQVKDTNGQLRSMDEILNDMGATWKNLTQVQQVALAQTVGGVRQYTQLVSLMDNWDTFQENLSIAMSSEGELDRQAEIYAESWEAARNRVKAAAEDVYDSFINPEFYKGLDDFFTPFLTGIGAVVDSLGGMQGVLATVALLINKVYGDKIAQSMRDMATTLGFITGQEQIRARELQKQAASLASSMAIQELGLTGADATVVQQKQKEVELRGKINSYIDTLNEQQQQILNNDLAHLNNLRLQTEEYTKQLAISEDERTSAKAKLVQQGSDAFGQMSVDKIRHYNTLDPNGYSRLSSQVEDIQNSVLNPNKIKTGQQAFIALLNELERINSIQVKYKAFLIEFDKLENKVKNLTPEMEKFLRSLSPGFAKLPIEEVLNRASNMMDQFNIRSQIINGTLQRLIPESLVPELEKYNAALSRGVAEQEAFANSSKEFQNFYNRLLTNLQNNTYATKDWADNMVKLGSALGQVHVAINAIQSIGNIISNDELTGWEKFTSILTSASMLLPIIGSGLKALNAVSKVTVALSEGQAVVTGTGALASKAKTMADKALAKAQTQVAKETALANVQFKIGLMTIAPYIAIVAALGVGIWALSEAYQADAKAAKEAAEHAELAQNAFTDTKNAAQELKDSISNWEDAVEALDKLKENTDEYAEALRKANEEAENLIYSYDLVKGQDYSIDKGIYNIYDDTLKNIQDSQQYSENISRRQLQLASLISAQANLQADMTQKVRDISASQVETVVSGIDGFMTGQTGLNAISRDDLSFLIQAYEQNKDASQYDFTKNFISLSEEAGRAVEIAINDFDKLKDSLDKVIASQEALTKANKQAAKEFLASDIVVKENAYIEETAQGNENTKVTLENWLSTIIGSQAYGDSTIADAIARVNISSTDYSDKVLGIDDEKDLAETYLREVLGYAEEKIAKLTYNDEGNFLDLKGDKIWNEDLPEEFMRKSLAYHRALNNIMDSTDTVTDDVKTKIASIIQDGVSIGGFNLTDSIINTIINEKDTIDFTPLFENIAPEEAIQLARNSRYDLVKALGFENGEALKEIGIKNAEAFLESFEDVFKNYDATIYSDASWLRAENAQAIVDTLIAGEELTSQQNNNLDKLIEKYSELAYYQDQGGHQYLQLLRDIGQQEEENAIAALQWEKDRLQTRITQQSGDLKSQEFFERKGEELINAKNYKSATAYYRAAMSFEIDTEQFEKDVNKLLEVERKLSVAIEADIDTDIEDAFDLRKEMDNFKELITSSTKISVEQAKKIIDAGYGEILTNSKPLAEGMMEIDNSVRDNFLANRQKEFEASIETQIAELTIDLEIAKKKRDLLIEQQKAMQKTYSENKDNITDQVIAEMLLQEQQTTNEILQMQIKEKEQLKSNERISTEQAKFLDAFGIMSTKATQHQIDLVSDAEKAEIGRSQTTTEGWNNNQLAVIRYNKAVLNQLTEYIPTSPLSGFARSDNVSASAADQISSNYQFAMGTSLSEIAANVAKYRKDFGISAESMVEAIMMSVDNKVDTANEEVGRAEGAITALRTAALDLQNKYGSGSGSSGSNGDGSKVELAKEKDSKDLIERYHEINREIEDQESLLEDLDNQAERTYGKKRLDIYADQLKGLEKQQAQYNAKLHEAENYLIEDKQFLQNAFKGYNLQFDENGELQNYKQLMSQVTENYNNDFLVKYNAFIEKYNAMSKAEQENVKSEYELWQQAKETADQALESKIQALSTYEDTLNEVQSINDAIEEGLRAIEDKKIAEVEYKLQTILDIKSLKDAMRQLEKAVAESFGDAITHGMQSAALDKDGMLANMALIPELESAFAEYKNLLLNANEYTDTEELKEKLKDIQSQAIEMAESLLDWWESLEELLPNTIDAARARFDAFLNQLDHNESILDTIKELYTLQGITYKTTQGFNQLQKVSQEKMDAQLAQAKLNRTWFEKSEVELQKAQQELDSFISANGDNYENELEYDALKANRDALLAEYNEAQSAMLSSAKEAMDTAQDMYMDALEKAVYDFGQIVSNGQGLDLLQSKYDNYIETEERYLDKVNEAYQTATWYNKIQADIENTSSSISKNSLQALLDELEYRKENNKLSQYDLDILEAKYNLLQAQMALEDAQNAKNQLRLTRDRQGNWNYQYTADQGQIDQTQQDLINAENEWYNIAKEQVKTTTGEILTTWQECSDKIKEVYSDMTLTDQERAARAEEIYNFYVEKIKYLEEEKQIAIKDMTEAGSEVIEDFANDYADDLDFMTDNTANFEEELKKIIEKAENDFQKYQDKVADVADQTGTSTEELADQVDKLSDSTDICREKGEDLAFQMWDQVSAIHDLSLSYIDLADSVREYLRALEDLARQSMQTIETGPQTSERVDYSLLMNQYEVGSKEYEEAKKKREEIEQGGYNTGAASTANIDALRKNDWTLEDIRKEYSGVQFFTDLTQNQIDELLKKKPASFSTGGYTGAFTDAKLAFLHEKELVLNKEDTENILSAVSAIRNIKPELFESIEKILDAGALAAMTLMGNKIVNSYPIDTEKDAIEQHVTIEHVEFPNVTSSNEIVNAFESIVNDASQWALRRKD